MNRIWLPLTILCAFFSQGAFSQSDMDEAKITELVARYLEVRAENDEQALLNLLTEDIDQLTTSGELRSGRMGVSSGSLASSQNNSGRRSIEIDSIRFIRPDVAITNGRYDILERANGPDRHYLTTFILVVENEQWKITAIRNMQPTP
jgi:uncharacterized protein (TIGR02246 family)